MLVVLTHCVYCSDYICSRVFALLFCFLQRWTVHCLHGGLAFHHRHASGWPAENEIRIESLPRHCIVAGARGVVDCQHQLRHTSRRHRLYEPCARANDSLLFGFRPNHEARNVLHKEKRSLLSVAAIDEVRDLLCALRINDSPEAGLLTFTALYEPALVGDYADG